MAGQEAAGTRGGALAVVASRSAADRDALRGILADGGYSCTAVRTGEALLEEVLSTPPDVLLVDLHTALDYAGSLAGVVAEHPGLAGIPAILLLPEGGAETVPGHLAAYVTDVVFRPVDAGELLHRTDAVISRRRRTLAQRASSARLREEMRRISARIRATNDPAVMVDQFLPAAGGALGARHLALQVFDDDRVSARSSSWTPDAGTSAPSVALQGIDRPAALRLALGLWEDSTTARFGTGAGTGTDGVEIPAWLGDALGGRTAEGVVAALGEGHTPFGLLWIIREESRPAWSGVEDSLTQHVLGNLAHGLIQAQLITRQHEAVRKLRALNQAKSDFVGTVNHELRTPLASIAGYLEMINDGVGGELPPEASTMLQAVERNTAKLSRLIDNISALSAPETDASEHGPVDIVHLVSQVTGRAVLEAAAGGITLEGTLPEQPLTVSGHREQLADALTIVLSNALKFTQRGGSVAVGLAHRPDDGEVVVAVRDTGIGIPPDDLPRLFDSFHRGSNANQTLPGAGVGLSLAKRTLEAHRGTITIESCLGVGTAVVITLPLLSHAAVG
ncbi:ATP-binding protein [Arthrobacter sp. B0490]|uniref:ATP-binding response regulator n=1 Tax=Arthrobacter sp. B0490 TaxID=2058891 RepID=UPI0011B00005|nr:ATP-binding protein [Arthrobacter sp. B0490]